MRKKKCLIFFVFKVNRNNLFVSISMIVYNRKKYLCKIMSSDENNQRYCNLRSIDSVNKDNIENTCKEAHSQTKDHNKEPFKCCIYNSTK